MSDVATTYEIEIRLKKITPPIYRRIRVPSNITLYELHGVIQVAMGWSNSHMHMFMKGRQTYEPSSQSSMEFESSDSLDERKYILSDVLSDETKGKFVYVYDFGDSWEHEIILKKILPQASSQVQLLEGRRACPPDDVGGTYGYEQFVEAMRDPKHPEHEAMLDWYGDEFDPEEFDVQAVAKRLAKLKFRSRKK